MATLIHPKEFPGGAPHNLGSFWKFRWSVKNPPADPDVTFQGKTVLLVGASSGLGFEAAVKYAQKGASKLILGVRSKRRGEDAKKEIISRAGIEEKKVTLAIVDFDSFASVKLFVSNLKKTDPYIDVVLLNAGGVWPKYVKSPEGYETTLQNFHDRGTPPHLTFVSSEGHTAVKREDYPGNLFETANDEKQFSSFKNYILDKFLGMIAMRRIAEATTKHDGTPEVIVNACCPFSTKSDMGKDFPKWFHWVTAPVIMLISRTTEQGSRTLVGATALDSSSQGKFWHHDWLYPTNELLGDQRIADENWEKIVKALETSQPDLKAILQG